MNMFQEAKILDQLRVERDVFLRSSLYKYMHADQIEEVIQSPCAANVISKEIVEQVKQDIIRKRCLWVGGNSALLSSGGSAISLLAMPVDFAQFACHAAKLSQELYYLYGTKDMFVCRSEEEMEILLVMMIGAGSTITLTTTSLSALGQHIFQKMAHKFTTRYIPIVGSVLHGISSSYILAVLAEEYIQRLKQMRDDQETMNVYQAIKQIDAYIDVEYQEVEDRIASFCNLEKLRDLYMYLDQGYISKQEFEALKR